MRWKRRNYYANKRPISILQWEVHKKAMKRTADHYKDDPNVTVTHKNIGQILKVIHVYIRHFAHNMHKNLTINAPSVVHLYFGYFRTIYPKVFIDMHKHGKFTDEEFDVIRNEFYKKEFDVYYRLIKNKAEWIKQQRLKEEEHILKALQEEKW